jgi:uncharacterized protein YyaL (SSP411 family)
MAGTRIGQRITADLLRRAASPADAPLTRRVDAGLSWLSRAQDVGSDRGFSFGYSIKGGWRPSYIETTGYIISTFLEAAKRLSRPNLHERAVEAGHWLTQVQLADGSFPNPQVDPNSGLVFDTGQDLHGLVSLANATRIELFLESAKRATDWLVAVADSDFRWTHNTFNRIPHVYNTRTAWALIRAAKLLNEPQAIKVAEANLDWACSEQQDNGWFENCAFRLGEPPFTHTTAYAGRGLLESGLLLGNDTYIDSATKVALAARRHLRDSGLLPSKIAVDDQMASRSSCLTGNAQFAIIWLELSRLGNNAELRQAATRSLHAVGRHQLLTGPPDLIGAIKGSHPIWGPYAPLCYPNWATKFFVDGLMLLAEPDSQEGTS